MIRLLCVSSLSNLVLASISLFAFGRFKISFFVKSLGVPMVYLRNGAQVRIGKGLSVRKRFGLRVDGGKVVIGNGCFFNNDCSLNSLGKMEIGSDTIFGEGVKIYDHNHVYDAFGGVRKNDFVVGEVQIGSRCWIGSGVIILKGTKICDDVVIAAGSIVGAEIKEPGVYFFDKPSVARKIR